ncbi:unnamed protein product, partial [Phaeothamnion confervicola]
LTQFNPIQVLEGLKYLHEQGVLHRDIKGANILTTKNGLVKLADFGVAMKLSDRGGSSAADDADVVGTPYWMAPEIIEMTGITTACDVWSVGCTIIELLSGGKPPYYDLPQMTALYKIVQDDHPPLPDGLTVALRDFLLQCFQKEPQMRNSAAQLLSHPWLKNPRSHLRRVGDDEMAKAAAAVPAIVAAAAATAAAAAGAGAAGGDGGAGGVAAAAAARGGVRSGGGRAGGGGPINWDRDLSVGGATPAVLALDGTENTGAAEANSSGARRNVNTISPNSEEAMQQLRAMRGSGAVAAAGPAPPVLDPDALDEWGDEDDVVPMGLPQTGGHCGGYSSVSGSGTLGDRLLMGASSSGGSVGGIVGREAGVLLRFAEDEETFDDIELPKDGGGGGLSFFRLAAPAPSALADRLKQKMARQQARVGSAAPMDPFGKELETEVDSEERASGGAGGGGIAGIGGISGIGGGGGGSAKRFERDSHARIGGDVSEELSRLQAAAMADTASLGGGAGVSASSGGGDGDSEASSSGGSGGTTSEPALATRAAAAAVAGGDSSCDDRAIAAATAAVLLDQQVAESCAKVRAMLDGCPEARFYVVSADHGVVPLLQLAEARGLGPAALAQVMSVINRIVDGNPKALEHLALVGMIPRIL